jgi:AAA15 family ATPase/GTPase
MSFRHIELDLTESERTPLTHAFIYGENGSGKSNLIESILFLKESVRTLNNTNMFNRIRDSAARPNASPKMDPKKRAGKVPLNKSPMQMPPDIQNMMNAIGPLGSFLPDLSLMAEGIRTVESDGGVSSSYHFVIGGHDGHYEMRFGPDNLLVYEKLSFTVEQRMSDIFEISASEAFGTPPRRIMNAKFSPSLFKKIPYKKTVDDLVQKYWGRHSFLSIMDDQYATNNAQYMEESIGTGIADVIRYFNGVIVCCNYSDGNVGTGISNKIMASLPGGFIAPGEKTLLLAYEDALNSFFTRIYSDVKRVYYKIEPTAGPLLQYTLCFSKMIGGSRREIEIFRESTGTSKLLTLFPAFYECARGKTVFFDELDSGIHDVLIKEIISEIKGTFKGQFIATTHNTSLLEVIEPKSVFLIQIDPRGEKKVVSMNSIERTQRNHNNRIRYMNGVFGSIPIMGEIDFDDIVQTAEQDLGGGI